MKGGVDTVGVEEDASELGPPPATAMLGMPESATDGARTNPDGEAGKRLVHDTGLGGRGEDKGAED